MDAVEDRTILESFSFYRRLPQLDSERLRQAVRRAELPTGAFAFHEGDVIGHLALVGSGRIRVFKTSATGREITLYHVREGQACLVSLLSILLHRPAAAAAVVESLVEALLVPAEEMRDLVRRQDVAREFVFESMGQRLIDVMTLTEEVAFGRLSERLSEFLCRRFENHGQPLTEIVMTHEQIAAELGTAREVVSRLLKVLERRGAIVVSRGRIELLSDAVLRQYLMGAANAMA